MLSTLIDEVKEENKKANIVTDIKELTKDFIIDNDISKMLRDFFDIYQKLPQHKRRVYSTSIKFKEWTVTLEMGTYLPFAGAGGRKMRINIYDSPTLITIEITGDTTSPNINVYLDEFGEFSYLGLTELISDVLYEVFK